MSLRRLLALLTAACPLAAGTQGARPAPTAAPTETVVYLVRHAEKVSPTDPDPSLSEAGAARARALADTLAAAGVRRVIVSSRRRTTETAAPLLQRTGLTPEVVPLTPTHVADVAAAVRRGGGPVLVVGHSNTIPAIVGALGGPRLPDLCDASYDQLFVVVLRDGVASTVTRRLVGARTPEGDACPGMAP